MCVDLCDSDDVRGHWPPIHPLVSGSQNGEANDCGDHSSFFVKVYMEGIPIGRKLNILAHDGYHELVKTLEHMFDTNILCKVYYCALTHSSLCLLIFSVMLSFSS